jgi:hypothetical protein
MHDTLIDSGKLVSLVEKRRELEDLRKEEQLRKENGLLFYRPHRKQELFHRANYRYRYVRTGNRFGKSDMGAAEDVSWLLGERLFFPKGDKARTAGVPQRPVKGLLIVNDWDKAEEIFTSQTPGNEGKLFKLIPKKAFRGVKKNQAGKTVVVMVQSKWGGVSELHIDTVKAFVTNKMGQESSDWDFIHVDEPIPQEMWVAARRGLADRSGSAWFACTPIDQPWINDMFLPSARHVVPDDGFVLEGKRWMITGSSYDNPYTSREGLEDFADDLTDDEKECRLYGVPRTMSGVVYKEFKPEVHVYRETPVGWKDMRTPPENYTIRVAIDTHPKTPHAVLFAATAPTGQVFFYKEIFRQVLIKDLSEAINETLEGRFVARILLEKAAFTDNPVDGTTMADVFMDEGLIVEPAPKDLTRGILEVKQALKQMIDGKYPLLNFSEELEETIWEFDHYLWDTKRMDKVKDKDDHFMECLYRLVITDLSYIEPDKESDVRFVPQASVDYSDTKFVDEPTYLEID